MLQTPVEDLHNPHALSSSSRMARRSGPSRKEGSIKILDCNFHCAIIASAFKCGRAWICNGPNLKIRYKSNFQFLLPALSIKYKAQLCREGSAVPARHLLMPHVAVLLSPIRKGQQQVALVSRFCLCVLKTLKCKRNTSFSCISEQTNLIKRRRLLACRRRLRFSCRRPQGRLDWALVTPRLQS